MFHNALMNAAVQMPFSSLQNRLTSASKAFTKPLKNTVPSTLIPVRILRYSSAFQVPQFQKKKTQKTKDTPKKTTKEQKQEQNLNKEHKHTLKGKKPK